VSSRNIAAWIDYTQNGDKADVKFAATTFAAINMLLSLKMAYQR